eukprot:630261-Rhodomonas_salina.1
MRPLERLLACEYDTKEYGGPRLFRTARSMPYALALYATKQYHCGPPIRPAGYVSYALAMPSPVLNYGNCTPSDLYHRH